MCRVRLDPIDLSSDEDIDFLFITRCNPTVCEYLIGKPPQSLAAHKAWLAENVPHKRLMYILRVGDLPAGYCHIYDFNPAGKTLEAGFVVHPNFQRHGFGGAMVKLLMSELVEKFTGWKVSLRVKECNTIALGLYEKCGFVRVGTEGGIVVMERCCDKQDDICV